MFALVSITVLFHKGSPWLLLAVVYGELIRINKLWACQKAYGLMVIEFCGALTALHEIQMKALIKDT